MKRLIELKLKLLAKLVLKKYDPQLIGITGSVGKTSAKEAVFCVLAASGKNVMRSTKNYNNEIGLPLTILGQASPGRNVIGWLSVFMHGLKLLVSRDPNYPEIIILEMGIDRPGDMDYLTSIAACDIGIVTTIGSVHLEYFKSKAELGREKGKLIKSIGKDGCSIVNFDDEETRRMADTSVARIMSYGFAMDAAVRASDVVYSYGKKGKIGELRGLSFKLNYQGASVPVHIPNALGQGVIYSALAAAAVGLSQGQNLLEISQALLNYRPPKGRLNIIPGIKKTTIIDDTYNAEPKSANLALETLKDIDHSASGRKLLALGDMLELGNQSEKLHREIGRLAAETGIEYLFCVGERARDIARGAKESGFPEDRVREFKDSEAAGRVIQDILRSGDLLLVKGSQGMRMERIVLELMNNPLEAKNLLVRQDEQWL